jgi:hypothetical protein
MNHARYRSYALSIFALCLCTGALALRIHFGGCMEPNAIVCSIDSRLSSSVAADIKTYCEHHFDTTDSATSATQLRNLYPCISRVISSCSIPKQLHISITAFDPLVRLTGNLVMTSEGYIMSDEYYGTEWYDNLPMITVPQEYMLYKKLPDSLYQLLCNIPLELFSRFACTVQRDHCLLLSDSQHPQTTILCDTHKSPDMSFCDLVEKIYALSTVTSHKKSKNTMIDIRFADQIVVYEDRRRLKVWHEG